jgi:ABC-type branched-subunit amino acid transport system ATPase component
MMNNLLEVKNLEVTIGEKALLQDISFVVTSGDRCGGGRTLRLRQIYAFAYFVPF